MDQGDDKHFIDLNLIDKPIRTNEYFS